MGVEITAMQILGQYNSQGEYIRYHEPMNVTRFGDTLRDSDGMVWAVLDKYGDWVSPSLKSVGIKNNLEVVG